LDWQANIRTRGKSVPQTTQALNLLFFILSPLIALSYSAQSAPDSQQRRCHNLHFKRSLLLSSSSHSHPVSTGWSAIHLISQNRFNGLPFGSDPETVKTVEPQKAALSHPVETG